MINENRKLIADIIIMRCGWFVEGRGVNVPQGGEAAGSGSKGAESSEGAERGAPDSCDEFVKCDNGMMFFVKLCIRS